jgi:hypothetical protein
VENVEPGPCAEAQSCIRRPKDLEYMRSFLDPDILSWPLSPDDYNYWDTAEDELRPYEIWRHSEALLGGNLSREHRVDIVVNLNRAIGIRLKTLNELYMFKKIPPRRSKVRIVEEMAELGIIRPILLKHITDLRNAVEHQDEIPPEASRCSELAEFTWYFLRSTDALVRGGCSTFIFSREKLAPLNSFWLSVHNGPELNWKPEIRGWLKPDMMKSSADDRWLAASLNEVKTREEHFNEVLGRSSSDFPPGIIGGSAPDDLAITGVIDGPVEVLRSLARKYFEARMRWLS